MRFLPAAAALCALAACTPPNENAKSEPAGCAAQAERAWAATPSVTLKISGTLAGADCPSAEATMVIADPAGKALYTHTMPIAPMTNTLFADAKTQADYDKGLSDWIDPNFGAETKKTSDLPEWKDGQENAGEGDFPFMPELSRADYAKLRAAGLPVLCHIQGGESTACIAYDEKAGAITKVGLQLFPG